MWSVAAATAVCALDRISLLDPGSDLHQKLGFNFIPNAYIFGSDVKLGEENLIESNGSDLAEDMASPWSSLFGASKQNALPTSSFISQNQSDPSTLLSSSMYLTSPYFVEVTTNPDPSFMTVWEWEKLWDSSWRRWMGQHWDWSIYASIIYLTLIFTIQHLMRNRKPFQIRGALTCWNIILAVFSIIGFIRTLPELLYVLSQPNGFYQTVCIRDNHSSSTAMWGWLMTLSKLAELGDTGFIVLRKQPLIFLHYYHHITVLGYTWFTYEAYDPALRYFMNMNMFVHGLMYSYYALKSLKIYVPRNFAMIITTLQLSQMVVGIFINVYSLYIKVSGTYCACLYENINLALLMYASYFALFARFFYITYLSKKKKLA